MKGCLTASVINERSEMDSAIGRFTLSNIFRNALLSLLGLLKGKPLRNQLR